MGKYSKFKLGGRSTMELYGTTKLVQTSVEFNGMCVHGHVHELERARASQAAQINSASLHLILHTLCKPFSFFPVHFVNCCSVH